MQYNITSTEAHGLNLQVDKLRQKIEELEQRQDKTDRVLKLLIKELNIMNNMDIEKPDDEISTIFIDNDNTELKDPLELTESIHQIKEKSAIPFDDDSNDTHDLEE